MLYHGTVSAENSAGHTDTVQWNFKARDQKGVDIELQRAQEQLQYSGYTHNVSAVATELYDA